MTDPISLINTGNREPTTAELRAIWADAKKTGMRIGTINLNTGQRSTGLPAGAENPKGALNLVTVTGHRQSQDVLKHTNEQRVRIRVPPKYLVGYTSGSSSGELGTNGFGGIIFPYTPTISYGVKADWSEIKPLHSNFNIPFYQRSFLNTHANQTLFLATVITAK